MAAAIGTWTFSKQAIDICFKELSSGRPSLDVVEEAVYAVEDDVDCGLYLVGRGAPPCGNGKCQFDAAIMKGGDCSFGAVAALEGIPTPIRVARAVMERGPHSMLVGTGAQQFAVRQGFSVEQEYVIQGKTSQQKQTEMRGNPEGHDTLGVIALDKDGKICVGVSTSGPGGKAVGRVGDSPLPGCGLYADDEVGAACSTGDGDHIMKYCPSFRTIEMMRAGLSPQDACTKVIQLIAKRHRGPMFEIGIIALNMKGEPGAAGSLSSWTDGKTGQKYPGFTYCVWTESMAEVQVKGQESCLQT